MRDLLIIFGMIVAAIAVGMLLFFFGPASFRASVGAGPDTVAFRLLKEGQNATAMTERANYSIENAEQLSELWGYIQATPGSTPSVDFTKDEVLAVFDGTHTTGGYYIQVTGVVDENGSRVVQVTRVSPGEGCVTPSAITSPYQVIVVPKSELPLTHEDEAITQDC